MLNKPKETNMSIFTRYKTIYTPRSNRQITAPAKVIEEVLNAGYNITVASSGRYATVYTYNKRTHKAEYVSTLAYFISDKVCGYKDGDGCNLRKSNLIFME